MRELLLFASLLNLFADTRQGMIRLETAKNRECQLLVTSGVLNIKSPTQPGSLLQTKTLDSHDSCRNLCCDLGRCNAYVWHTTGHCFLFRCDSGDKCPIVPNYHAETGYLYRGSGKGGSSSAHEQSKKEVLPLKRDNQDESPGESSESQIKAEKDNQNVLAWSGKDGAPKSVGNHLEQAEATQQEKAMSLVDKKSSKLPAESTNEGVKREPIASLKNSQKGSGSAFSYTTPAPISGSNVRPTKASHTTTTSLIAALCFGLMFLIAVLFLIGRRWYESVSGNGKSGYSRVSFLMNGM